MMFQYFWTTLICNFLHDVPVDFARSLTKEQLRGPIIQKLEQRQEADIKNFANYITKSAIQKALGNYLEMLKARQSSKKE